MTIEIDGKSYIIHPKTEHEYIQILKAYEDNIHLSVPANFSQESLIVYIKKQLKKDLRKLSKSNQSEISSIQLFDKTYQVRTIDSTIPYLKDNIIHASAKQLLSIKGIESIKVKLLENYINNLISNIEEDNKIIIPEIFIRQLKTNYFTICHNNKTITFSKKLIDKPLSFIIYIVILGIVKYFDFTPENSDNLIKQYVSDWKHCERLLKYEQ